MQMPSGLSPAVRPATRLQRPDSERTPVSTELHEQRAQAECVWKGGGTGWFEATATTLALTGGYLLMEADYERGTGAAARNAGRETAGTDVV